MSIPGTYPQPNTIRPYPQTPYPQPWTTPTTPPARIPTPPQVVIYPSYTVPAVTEERLREIIREELERAKPKPRKRA